MERPVAPAAGRSCLGIADVGRLSASFVHLVTFRLQMLGVFSLLR